MNALPRGIGLLATAALVATSLLAPSLARADSSADITAFLSTGLADAPTDFAALRGNPIPHNKGEFWVNAPIGNLKRCMVLDMPSMAAVLDDTDASDESDLECTSPRLAMTQAALLSWLTRTIEKALGPGYKIERYPARKHGDRSSIHWTLGPTSVHAIVSGNADAPDRNYGRNFFYISIAHTHVAQDGSN